MIDSTLDYLGNSGLIAILVLVEIGRASCRERV